MSQRDRTANLLGAVALAVTDQTTTAMTEVAGHATSAAAALSALDQFLDRPTIDRLRSVLGLTPSGTVRLVDRLAEQGYVTRGPGADGRTRSVALTRKGKRAAARITAARSAVLAQSLARLSATEVATLHTLLGRVVEGLVRHNLDRPGQQGWLCRLCDLTACGRADGACPTANIARALTAVASDA